MCSGLVGVFLGVFKHIDNDYQCKDDKKCAHAQCNMFCGTSTIVSLMVTRLKQ